MKIRKARKMAIPIVRAPIGDSGVRPALRATNRLLAAGGGKDAGVGLGDTP